MPDLSPITIRRPHPDEAGALAQLHVDIWRATYQPYATPEAYAQLDTARRLPHWQAAIAKAGPGYGAWLAEQGKTLAGVISLNVSRHPGFDARQEITHLYVAQAAQGQGIGAALLHHALDHCRAAGCAGVALAVVTQNTAARKFYRKMGGREIGAFTDPGPLWRSDNIVVAWDF